MKLLLIDLVFNNHSLYFCRDYYLDNGEQRFMQDGVNSVTYKLISYKKLPLYTHITVEFNYTEIMGCVNSLGCSSQARNPLIYNKSWKRS